MTHTDPRRSLGVGYLVVPPWDLSHSGRRTAGKSCLEIGVHFCVNADWPCVRVRGSLIARR
jgi:hypothetical protein